LNVGDDSSVGVFEGFKADLINIATVLNERKERLIKIEKRLQIHARNSFVILKKSHSKSMHFRSQTFLNCFVFYDR
jgi:hypothetical protein